MAIRCVCDGVANLIGVGVFVRVVAYFPSRVGFRWERPSGFGGTWFGVEESWYACLFEIEPGEFV